MPNLAAVLKDEIRRLAKKEAKEQLAPMQKASAQHRRDIASLKRTNTELSRKVAQLERALRKATPAVPEADSGREVRFAAEWVINHRDKVGLTQSEYGRLVGVSAMTIYNWEGGHSRPRADALAKWGAIKKLGKREAAKVLEGMG